VHGLQAQGGADPLTGGEELRRSEGISPPDKDETPDRAVSPARAYVRVALTSAVVIALDQITKSLAVEHLSDGRVVEVIPGVLQFRLGFNSGGAFGLLQGLPGLFLVTTGVVMTIILLWIRRVEDPRWLIPLGMVLGGGLGNFADRIFREFDGRVVDFIDFHVWPIFNLADTAIVVGVLLVVIISWRPRKEERAPAGASE
jgi:signal peptidase II